MVAAPALWSTAGAVTRHIERADPFEQVFWRSLFAFAFVFAFLLFRGRPFSGATRKPALISGAMWAVMFTAFVIALSLTSTANTLVVMSISPVLTALLAWIVLREPVPLRTWIAAAMAAVGIAWMAASNVSAQGARDAAGMLVALIVPIASAINVVTLRSTVAAGGGHYDLRPAVMMGAAVSAAVALPLALPFEASARDLALLGFLGCFQLGLPCLLLVVASRVLPASEIALLGLLEIVLGVLWAWLAGETPAAATLAGGAVVLTALILNELRLPRAAAQAGDA